MAEPSSRRVPVGWARGTPVAVHNSFTSRWVEGFVVESSDCDAYRLRRLSDNAVLRAPFPPEVLRQA